MPDELIAHSARANRAREIIRMVEQHQQQLRSLVWELFNDKGWEDLGYATFTACIRSVFQVQTRTYVYRLAIAGEVEHSLSKFLTPEDLRKIPDSHLIELAAIQDPEHRAAAYEQVVAYAERKEYAGRAAKWNGKITAKLIRQIVARYLPEGSTEVQQTIETLEESVPIGVEVDTEHRTLSLEHGGQTITLNIDELRDALRPLGMSLLEASDELLHEARAQYTV